MWLIAAGCVLSAPDVSAVRCRTDTEGCSVTSLPYLAPDARYTGEASRDFAGASVSAAGDVNGDGFADVLVGANDNDAAGSDAGAAYLVLGSATPTSRSLAAADARYTGELAGDIAGYGLSGAGDVNGDGFDDVVVGAHYNSAAGYRAGAAYLVLGSATPASRSLAAADARYTGEFAEDLAGFSVSVVGDVNGDGFDDVVLGAPVSADGERKPGAAYLVLGSATPTSRSLAAADARFAGEAAGDGSAYSLSGAGDVDGDGLADVLIGAFRAEDAGAVSLLLGSGSPTSRLLSEADARYTGESAGDWAGYSVSTAGDVNGDGLADILVGAPQSNAGGSTAGAAYLVLGSATPTSRSLAAADARYTGQAVGDVAGGSVSTAGDVNGDGFADLLLSATGNHDGGPLAGAAYLVLGSAWPSSESLETADARFTGMTEEDKAGAGVSTAGDVDGDGFDDLLVGAKFNDVAGAHAGAAYVVLGFGD